MFYKLQNNDEYILFSALQMMINGFASDSEVIAWNCCRLHPF